MTSLNPTVSWLFSFPQRVTSYRFLNSLGNARSNISAHYDLSDDMFKGAGPRCVSVIALTTISSLFIERHDLLVCHLF